MRANASKLVSMRVTAPETKPSIRLAIDASTLPDTELCSYNELNRALCVSNLRTAFEKGLKTVVETFCTPDDSARALRLEFRIEKLSHRPTSLGSGGYNTSRVDLDWGLKVLDATGAVVLDVHESTPSPQPVTYNGYLDPIMGRMVGATLEDVARVLVDSKLTP